VASLKIVGREASPLKKLASVRMVRDIVDRVRAGVPRQQTIDRARSLRGEPHHCDSGYMCQYHVPTEPVQA
jgi:putative protease